MGVPHITSFCWCMGLEVGAKCVGYMHLLTSVIIMIICSMFAENTRGLVGTVEDMDQVYYTLYKISVIAAVLSVVHVLLAFTLIISIYKRSTVGLRVWVWAMSILYVAAIVSIVVFSATKGLSGSGSDIFLSFLEGLVFFGVLCYCILCVYSYYLMLKSSEDMEGPKAY